MSMTPASSEYFHRVASVWDRLRSGFFTDAVRETAIQKAYLRPEHIVAVVGAGSGFMSAGMAPLVSKVIALDGSLEMLEVARKNLQGLENVEFQEADGLSLPLPDESMDAVFANMYLHHCPDPQAAIVEMVRILRPGGRLVITDMDVHPYAWLKEEMADVWQGFERQQLHSWYQEAGLVNMIVDCTGQSCCARSEQSACCEQDEQEIDINVFVAVGTRRIGGVRETVQDNYGALAEGAGGCCSPSVSSEGGSCCNDDKGASPLITLDEEPPVLFSPFYSREELAAAPAEASELILGCGNPTALARLKEGEVVLDIGSGAGLDSFLAASKVGPQGRVIGVDMTPAMLERARKSAAKAGLSQVEFRQGQAEALPVGDGEVDVVISNCVINLCEDKGLVFREAARVLKMGGRLEVSDVVTSRSFPLDLLNDPVGWSGCILGALPEKEYLDLVAQAGFGDIRVQRSESMGSKAGVIIYNLLVSAQKLDQGG